MPRVPTTSLRALAWLVATAVVLGGGVLVCETLVCRAAAAALQHRCAHADARAARLPRPELRSAVVCLINDARAAHGLPLLRESSRLDGAAQRWTDTMVATGDFTHGSDPAARITAAGIRWSVTGENIATGYPTPRRVVAAWMASLGHCRNILNPSYSMVGTGVNRHSVRGYASGPATWTEDFALPADHQPRSHNWGPADSCR